MAYEIRSISQVGTSEPFELQVARGQIPGHSLIHKFGANFEVDNNSEPETVWTFGGLYPWAALSSAQTLYCASTSASDTDVLEVYGLDADFNEQIETVQSFVVDKMENAMDLSVPIKVDVAIAENWDEAK